MIFVKMQFIINFRHMEVPGGHNAKSWVCLYEFFGAALLIFTVNASQSGAFAPLAIGLALFAGINMFGDVSGAHFNPAVTTAVFIKEGGDRMGDNFGFMILIMFSQVLGCVFGVLIASISLTTADNVALLCPPPGNSKLISVAEGYECAPANGRIGFNMLVAEIIGTFTLCGVILIQKYNSNAPGALKAFAVGLTLTLSICMIGGITGGCLNPAVGFVQTIFQDAMIVKRDLGDGVEVTPGYGSLWLYLLGPLGGGILAGLMSKMDESARESLQPDIKYRGAYGRNEEEQYMNA